MLSQAGFSFFFFFLLQNHAPSAVTQRSLNYCCAHPCAPHSQAHDQRVERGIWMLEASPSLGVCTSAGTSEERHPPPPLQSHALTSHCMNVNHIHPKAKKRNLRNVIFSLIAPFTWIGWRDKEEVEVNAKYNKVYLAQQVIHKAKF